MPDIPGSRFSMPGAGSPRTGPGEDHPGEGGLAVSAEVPWRWKWRRLDRVQRAGLTALAVLTGLTVWKVAFRGAGGGGNGGEMDFPGGGAALAAVLGIVWSLAVAGAGAAFPVAGFVAAGLWLGWSGLALMGPWAGTPLILLPGIWLLWVVLVKMAWRHPRWQVADGLGWAGICLALAGWMAEPAGLGRLPGAWRHPAWQAAGVLVLAGLPGWAGVWLRPRIRGWKWTRPDFCPLLAGSAGVMTLALTASFLRDRAALEGWAVSVRDSLAGGAALAWFFLGGAATLLAVQGAGVVTRWTVRTVPPAGRVWFFPGTWLAVTGLEWAATHQGLEFLTAWLALPPVLGNAGVSRFWENTLWAHAWTGVVVLALGTAFLWQEREKGNLRALERLNALWLTAFAGLALAGGDLSGGKDNPWADELSLAVPGKTLSAGVCGAVLLAAGTLWMIGRTAGERLEARPGGWRLNTRLWTGLAVMTGLILAAGEGAGEGNSADRVGPLLLLGMMHAALPLALHAWWRDDHGPAASLSRPGQQARGGGGGAGPGFPPAAGRAAGGSPAVLSPAGLAGLLLAGAAGVLPLLQRNGTDVSQLSWLPVYWAAVLLVVKKYRPFLDPAGGALAGSLLGSASVAVWCRPDLLLPEVPHFSGLNAPWLTPDGRPFMDPRHFTLLVMLWAAGAVVGVLVFRPRQGDGALPVIPLPPPGRQALPPPLG